MLRFLLLVSVCLSALFTLVGAALSREWGWNEYASDELYLIYSRRYSASAPAFFLVNTRDGSPEEQLTWGDADIFAFHCSPDGRLAAFISGDGQLYVTDESGIIYSKPVDLYDRLTVSNNGTVAFTKIYGSAFFIDQSLEQPVPASNAGFDDGLAISSSGYSLAFDIDRGMRMVAPSGSQIRFVPGAFSGDWLATENIVIFNTLARRFSGHYFMDLATQRAVEFIPLDSIWALSPDATKRAFNRRDEAGNSQTFIAELASSETARQLTHNDQTSSLPMCFLTFRPEMLIDQSS